MKRLAFVLMLAVLGTVGICRADTVTLTFNGGQGPTLVSPADVKGGAYNYSFSGPATGLGNDLSGLTINGFCIDTSHNIEASNTHLFSLESLAAYASSGYLGAGLTLPGEAVPSTFATDVSSMINYAVGQDSSLIQLAATRLDGTKVYTISESQTPVNGTSDYNWAAALQDAIWDRLNVNIPVTFTTGNATIDAETNHILASIGGPAAGYSLNALVDDYQAQ